MPLAPQVLATGAPSWCASRVHTRDVERARPGPTSSATRGGGSASCSGVHTSPVSGRREAASTGRALACSRPPRRGRGLAERGRHRDVLVEVGEGMGPVVDEVGQHGRRCSQTRRGGVRYSPRAVRNVGCAWRGRAGRRSEDAGPERARCSRRRRSAGRSPTPASRSATSTGSRRPGYGGMHEVAARRVPRPHAALARVHRAAAGRASSSTRCTRTARSRPATSTRSRSSTATTSCRPSGRTLGTGRSGGGGAAAMPYPMS